MADQPPPRRRFQFRLRTLMIVVTLLAVPMAYVGWQANIVRARQLMMRWIKEHDGYCLIWLGETPTSTISMARPSLLRRWMGDVWIVEVWFHSLIARDDAAKILEAFPGVQLRYNGLPDPVLK